MKKSRIFAMAALAALALSGCAKNDNGKGVPADGSNATMSLSFTLPVSDTRAVSQASLPPESAVNTADVFIFNPDGTKTDKGAYSAFAVTAADFTIDAAHNVYTLKNASAIETLSGSHDIYVGINLPTAVRMEYATENALFAAVASVADMSVANNFSMFSKETIVDLQGHDYNGGTEAAPYVNAVSMPVDRIVAKVVGSSSDSTYTVDWMEVHDFNMLYTIKGFRVMQEAVKSYVVPNYLDGKPHTLVDDPAASGVLNSFAVSAAAPLITMPNPHPATEAGLNALSGAYVGENAPLLTTNGATTYAMVATTVVVNKKAVWDPALDSGAGGIAWEAVTGGYGGGTTDIYLVKYEGYDYLTASVAEASAIKAGLDAIDNVTPKVANIYTYTKGWVHFQVFLNKGTGLNQYAVLRNQFVHVKVNGVIGNDFFFPGYPGEPTNPEKPTPPTGPPTDLVDGSNATLIVDVTVNPWLYSENAIILGK